MSVTQQQLASELGVSQMAVSFALNDKPGVNASTRRRILAAANKAGYRPNAAARATRSGLTRNIELILGLHEGVSRMQAGLLEGIHDELAECNLHLLVSRVADEKLSDEVALPRMMREVAADGLLIYYTHQFPPKLLELIDRYNLPAIWMNAPVENRCVRPDDVAAGQLATEHLIAAGHRRIALFFVTPAEHYSGQARQQGYEQAMHAAGLEPQVVVQPSRRYAQIRRDVRTDERLRLTQDWLTQSPPPEAIIAYSVAEAGALLLAAGRLGLRLPEDLALVTIADEITPYLGLPITTVVLPWGQIGRVAVQQLCEQIRTGCTEPAPLIEIAPHLEQGVTSHHVSVSR